jgi:hypothetical protein
MRGPITSYWELLEPEFERINIYEGPEKFAASCQTVWRPIVLLYATHMCAAEVQNGGFLQLFWNNTGVAVPDAIEGYRLIGMPNLASLVDQAARQLGTPYPLDRDDRWDALLVASGRSSEELEGIFQKSDNLYESFVEATEPMNFDPLDRKFWQLASEESGGYDIAATLYAQSVTQVH